MSVRSPLSLSLPLEAAFYLFSNFGGRRAHRDARFLHRLHLVFRSSRSARDNRARVTHAASRRRSLPGDETHHWLLDMGFDVFGGRLLRAPADLADHHDGMRVRVRIE